MFPADLDTCVPCNDAGPRVESLPGPPYMTFRVDNPHVPFCMCA